MTLENGRLLSLALLCAAACGDAAAGPSHSQDAEAHVASLLRRIHDLDGRLHSVIRVNPDAVADARRCASDPRTTQPGSLGCLALVVKDNIQVADLPTTAGSSALTENIAADAPIIAALRERGAVILGKANLSEWANYRSISSISGWSAVGGQTHNPYALNRSPAGSSSGSAVAVAAELADAAIGTDTGGSITAPASMNGIVGFKPTIGLVSRAGIVPVSSSQDSAGPMARDVETVARILQVIAFEDPADPITLTAPPSVRATGFNVSPMDLSGVRFGVLRWATGYSPGTDRVFEAALAALRRRGAVLIDIQTFDGLPEVLGGQKVIWSTEFKAGMDDYLASAPAAVSVRSLADLITFNKAHADVEMPLFGQELFERAEATSGLSEPGYIQARERAHRLAGPDGIDRMLRDNDVVVLIAPTLSPAFFIDAVNGDHHAGGGEVGALAAVARYPHLTVPMGYVHGLPVGLSVIGTAWSDRLVLSLGLSIEHEMPPRIAPTLAPSLEELLETPPGTIPPRGGARR